MKSGFVLPMLALAGCAAYGPHERQPDGPAVRALFAAQVIDPHAAARPYAGDRLDGRSARRSQERFEQSFADPAPAGAPLMGGAGK